jgi:arylsulfatase A-like enzyme
MIGLAHRGFRLNDYKQHIVHTLREQGYHSMLLGVQHVAQDPSVIGYDEVWPHRRAEDLVRQATSYLQNPPPAPFFMDVGFKETHRPYPDVPSATDECFCRPPVPLPDTAETRLDMAAFAASVRLLDESVGRVLDALDASGLAENTLVVCTTDHGIAFPGMKCTLTDHGIGVLLLMRWPRGFPGGRMCDALVSHVDIFPTICECIGAQPPAWLQGRSMMPLLDGREREIRDETFAEITYHAAYEPQRAVRTKRWTYIRRFGDRRTPVLANCDDSPSKDVWLQHGWAQRRLSEEELYDLVYDPCERHNIAAEPDMNEVRLEMSGRLERWMAVTGDPLLLGPVPAPRGVRLNDQDDLSPSTPTSIPSNLNLWIKMP